MSRCPHFSSGSPSRRRRHNHVRYRLHLQHRQGEGELLRHPPGATDSLIAVPLETSGLATDATLIDLDSLSAILAGTSNEQTTLGRVTLSGVTNTVDDATDSQDSDFDDFTWASASGNAISKIIICYKPDSGAADTAIIPLTAHDFDATPDGNDLVVQVDSAGFYGA